MKLSYLQIKSIARGVTSVEEKDGSVFFRRFTPPLEEFYASVKEDFRARVRNSAGVRLDFYTDSPFISMSFGFGMRSSRICMSIDIYENEALTYSYIDEDFIDRPGGSFTFNFERKGRKRVTVHLPYTVELILTGLELSDGAEITPFTSYAGRVMMFGDSITHGYDALRTSFSYASRFARIMNYDLSNQGVGGFTFFPEVLDKEYIDEWKPDIITVAYGTNDWNGRTRELFEKRTTDFWERLAQFYPDIQAFCITPAWRADNYRHTAAGDFEEAREYIAAAAKRANPKNVIVDGNLTVPHGNDFFGDKRLHPNDLGFADYAERLIKAVLENKR